MGLNEISARVFFTLKTNLVQIFSVVIDIMNCFMSRNAKKTERGTLWSRRVLYVTLEKTFWFSSLGQQGQFKIL